MEKKRLLLMGTLFITSLALAQSPAQYATVNGEAVTETQVLEVAKADLSRLEANRPQGGEPAYARARLEILWRALDSIIDDKLITAEAARQMITREHLLEAEVESNVATPSPAEVDEFYEMNKARIPIPKAEALPQVRQYMIDQSRRRYRENLIRNLKRNHKVVTHLDPLRTEIPTSVHPAKGPANAPITIVEFADFECPFCGGLFPTLKQVEKNYGDRVRFVYRQFPLTTIHPRAQKAAEASLCAHEQQKFWEFHDSMFSNQAELSVDSLKRRAVELKLNTASFNACLDSGRMADAVRKDAEEAAKLGVSSTPTTFINGRLFSGNQLYADIRAVIEDELQRATKGQKD
jgi:protein-disulfide isomerase